MKRLLPILFLCVTASAVLAQDQVLVIANTADPELRLERHEVRSLFMGNLRRADLAPISLPPQHPARVVFNTRVVGLTESRVQSYWAQMRFSGRSKPPPEVEGLEQLLNYLLETPGAVGYVPTGHPVPEGLAVIYRTE